MNYLSVAAVELGRSRNSQPAEATPRTSISFSCRASPACNHTALYSSLYTSNFKVPIVALPVNWLRVEDRNLGKELPETAEGFEAQVQDLRNALREWREDIH